MSRLSKVVVAILIVVVVALLIMWYVPLSNTLSTGAVPPAPDMAAVQPQSTTTPVVQAPVIPPSDVSQRDASDASLDADLKSIDEQLKSVTTETSALDKSLSDTPLSQNP
jgi:hypothetical protein